MLVSLSADSQSYNPSLTPNSSDVLFFIREYSNARPDDLFVEWEKVSKGVLPEGLRFTDFAISWTEQDGVPVVTAIRNYETSEITFTQERHFDEKPTCACGYNRTWWIPLTWITQANKSNQDQFKPLAWLKGNVTNEKLVQKVDLKPGQWFLLNPRSVGEFQAKRLKICITIQRRIPPQTHAL